ncbi:hypothetical protein CF319_g9037 [Tilletia indica]|nr:hypothetical protein CF319_g9037 [Tilletia indica]
MSSSLHFLTFSPIDSLLPAQTVVFSPSDHLQLLVGGVRVDHYHLRPPHHTADFIFNEQFLRPDHCRLELVHHTPILTNCRDSGTTRVNGSALERNERVVLQHSDKVELGHLDEYSGDFDNTLAFVVRLSSSPPVSHHRPIPADSLLSTTSSVFAALRSAEDTRRRMYEELTSTQQKLQAALKAAVEHTCGPPFPPRPYGTLLADLRGAVDDITRDTPSGLVAIAAPMSSPPPSWTPSASRSASNSPLLSASVVPASSSPPSFSSRKTTSPFTSTPPSADSHAPTVVSPSPPTSAPSTPPSPLRHPTAPSSTSVNPPSTLVLSSVLQSNSSSSSTILPPSGTSPSTSVLPSAPASACTSPVLDCDAGTEPTSVLTSVLSVPSHSPSTPTSALRNDSPSTSPSAYTDAVSITSCSSTSSPSSSSASESSAFISRPHQRPSKTSVLTSVLGSTESSTLPLHMASPSSSDFSTTAASQSPTSLVGVRSAIDTAGRIRTEWMRARASLLHANSAAPPGPGDFPSSPSSLELVLARVRRAWIDARVHVMEQTDFTSDPSPAPIGPVSSFLTPPISSPWLPSYSSPAHPARNTWMTRSLPPPGPGMTHPLHLSFLAQLRVALDGLQRLFKPSSAHGACPSSCSRGMV